MCHNTKFWIFLSTLSLRRATVTSVARTPTTVISIHALLAESDPIFGKIDTRGSIFLSTLSLRRATTYLSILFQKFLNFYPRSPCGERHCIIDIINNVVNHFYPRSPCGERPIRKRQIIPIIEFLSTLSLRRATNSSNTNLRRHRDFYPRSPCGERLPQ